MKRIVFVILLLSVAVFAAERQKITAVDFSPGLVTAKGKLTKGFNEADIAWNIDFTRNRRQAGPRLGYGKQTTVPLVDSILWNGLEAVNYRSGDKQMLVVAKWTDSNWAGLFASELNGFGFGVVDSLSFVVDTAAGIAEAEAVGRNDYCLRFTIYKQGVEIYDYISLFDTTTTRAELVDTFLIGDQGIAACAACSSYLRFTDLGDTMVIAEADQDFGLTFGIEGNNAVLCDSTFLSAGTNWDSVTEGQSADTADIVLSRLPATGSPRFAQHRDNVYIVNGTGRGAVYNGRTTSDFPMRSPGEPSILPILTDGTMHGTYRYAFAYTYPEIANDSVLTNSRATLSQPVRVDSSNGGTVQIYNWQLPNADAWHATDSVHISVWRTVGDFGILDKSDSIWFVDSVIIPNEDSAASVQFVDTMSDVTLRTQSAETILDEWTWIAAGSNWQPDSTTIGLDLDDTVASRVSISPGTPTFTAAQNCTDSDSGMWRGGAVSWETVLGWSWIVVAVDTVTNIPSDSSRSIWMYQRVKPDTYTSTWNTQGADSVGVGFARSDQECVEMVIPRVTGAPNTVFDLYRAPVTARRVDSLREIIITGDGSPDPYGWVVEEVIRTYANEQEVALHYFIGQFNPGDTVIDSLQFDSLLLRDIYRHNVAPSTISDVVAAGNRLIAMDESNVYMTELIDTITRFNVLNQKPVNPDGGDQNTGLWSTSQGVVKVAKNKSLYNLYRSGGLWQIPELSDNFGMVAPLSHAKGPEGDYFLSLDGVRLLAEGGSKDRSFIPFEVSAMLSNFDNLETSVLKNAIGIYHDNKYIASFPDLDTAFVLNIIKNGPQERSFGWSQWGLVPVAHAFYRVSANNIIIPGDSLYFSLSGDPSIYVFASSQKDDGQDVFWQYRSGPTNPVDGHLHYIEEVAMYLNSDESDPNPYTVQFYNEKGVVPSGMSFQMNRLDTANYHEFDGVDTLGGEGALFWQFDIQRNVIFYDSGITSLEGLWITTSKREKYGSQ